MTPDLVTHTLVRIEGVGSLLASDAAGMPQAAALLECPDWAASALTQTPWVVVRRAQLHASLYPVGVRGSCRSQRLAAWLERANVLDCISPQTLVQRRSWAHAARCQALPALAALGAVESIMSAHGLAGAWGPTGSIGFELATGHAAATLDSDLDIAVWPAQPLPVAAARSLQAQLARLPVRVDALLETPRGAVALAEFARSPGSCLLRTTRGALLVDDCWAQTIEVA
jgi:phosphoribosyl-dephospho-CoA transferase